MRNRAGSLFRVAFLLGALLPLPALAQASLPTTVDWRTRGAVSPVRDAGQCGASWAFAAVAALEGEVAIKTGHLLQLSEQELIDCSHPDGNMGCNGGTVDGAFHFIIRHGITSAAAYPYTARDGTCRMGKAIVARMSSFRAVASDMHALMTAVAAQPVAVEIDGGAPDFHSWGGGIYGCHPGTPNTWVTIVGYGTDAAGRAYWLVKNSWGTGWAEHGYVRMTRSQDCANIGAAVVPVL